MDTIERDTTTKLLSTREIAAYRRDGFVVVPKLIGAKLIAACVDAISGLASGRIARHATEIIGVHGSILPFRGTGERYEVKVGPGFNSSFATASRFAQVPAWWRHSRVPALPRELRPRAPVPSCHWRDPQ